jgi:superfamily II DNA helicase RecQ
MELCSPPGKSHTTRDDNPGEDDIILRMAVEAMAKGFGRTPRNDQDEDLVKLLTIGFKNRNGTMPTPVLYCKATDEGKSLCRDTIAYMLGDVNLVVSPLLGLGADQ